MWPVVLLAIYCLCILFASLAGGWIPSLMRLTHSRMQLMMSFVAGLMLGVGLFHMLPHSVETTGSLDRSIWWLVVGLISMFFLIRAFHFHQHDHSFGDHDAHSSDGSASDEEHGDVGNQIVAQTPTHDHAPAAAATTPVRWIGVALGLSLHTLIDGVALAASVEADAVKASSAWFLGLGTFLAIVLHKPLDALSITSLMKAGGWSSDHRLMVNAGFALMCPLGAALFDVSLVELSSHSTTIIGCALAFSAGTFLCISLSDLLPELHFHKHDRIKLSLALLLGIALAYFIGYLEPTHSHKRLVTDGEAVRSATAVRTRHSSIATRDRQCVGRAAYCGGCLPCGSDQSGRS
jgi:zinc and cadmium transporter